MDEATVWTPMTKVERRILEVARILAGFSDSSRSYVDKELLDNVAWLLRPTSIVPAKRLKGLRQRGYVSVRNDEDGLFYVLVDKELPSNSQCVGENPEMLSDATLRRIFTDWKKNCRKQP